MFKKQIRHIGLSGLILLVSVVLCICLGCTTSHLVNEQLQEIHPGVFSMVICLLSDTSMPVATEVNLDAVSENNDQFNGWIRTEGEWTRVDFDNDRGFIRYRLLRKQDNYYEVLFQSNGGGTLTTSTEIGFTLFYRIIEVNSEETQVQVLRVESISWSNLTM